MPRKKETVGRLKKKLQILVNRFCKLRDCKDGGANCISCGKWYPVSKLHGGHYIPSTYGAMRFNEQNINAQCGFNCNLSKHGNTVEYRIGLIKKIGLEAVEYLEAHRNDPVKWSLPKLREQILIYKEKLNEM